MRWHRYAMIILALPVSAALSMAVAEQDIEYYTWTDENGVIHASGTPPADRDYETRRVGAEENVIRSPDTTSGAAGSLRAGSARHAPVPPIRVPRGIMDAAIAEAEQRRREEGDAPAPGGAVTAPGAETAPSGASAPAGSAASGGAAASGAATAPGAIFAPPPLIGP